MHYRYKCLPFFLFYIALSCSCGVNPIEGTSLPMLETVPVIPTEVVQNPTETVINTSEILSQDEYLIEEEISRSIEIAQLIIDELTKYREDNQNYPETLQTLVPDFYNELPVSFSDGDFEYKISEPDGYILSFKITRMGKRWYCGYLEQKALWDCSGDGSMNFDPTNPLDVEGLYSEQNLVGYMNYNTTLTRIYNTIVIYRSGEQDWHDPLTIQEAQMMSGFYDIGYHYVIGEDGTIYEARDLNFRGNHGFPNYGRIGIFLMGELTEEQYESTATLVESLDYQYKLDYLYGDYEAPGIYPERIPSDTEIEWINEMREIILLR